MSNLSELGISPINSRLDFVKIVNRGLFPQLTPKDIEELIPIYWGLDRYTLKNFRIYLEKFVKLFDKDWGGFSDNFTVLDIACGSGFNGEGFYPWLPAIMSRLGADVVGIDIGIQPGELSASYRHVQFDLTELPDGGIPDIPDIKGSQFDLVTFLNTINPYNSSDLISKIVYDKGKTLDHTQEKIFNNIGSLVKNNGILFADTRQGWQQVFRKTRNSLTLVK